MVYTKEVYTEMIERCKSIASDFMKTVTAKRAPLDPVNNEDDIDEFEISQEEIIALFEQFKQEMGLESEIGFFRDNDEEYGRYSEHMDAVSLPLCIGCYPGRKIVEHMTHELFHAFQYAAICEPDNYPCFDEETIKKWDYEFKNYISGDKNMRQYLGQEIEKSARAFGEMMGNKDNSCGL